MRGEGVVRRPPCAARKPPPDVNARLAFIAKYALASGVPVIDTELNLYARVVGVTNQAMVKISYDKPPPGRKQFKLVNPVTRLQPLNVRPDGDTSAYDVEVNEHDGHMVEILVFNGELNGAYVSPERAIEFAEEIVAVAKKVLANDDTRRGE